MTFVNQNIDYFHRKIAVEAVKLRDRPSLMGFFLMTAFCEDIVSQIKQAATKKELEQLVERSLLLYKSRTSHNVGSYFLNMIVTLQATKQQQQAPEIVSNIDFAINIFRELRKQNPRRLF